MEKKKDAGQVVRDWLTKKMGNPIMTSKMKDAIAKLEDPMSKDEALSELQEKGDDYDARVHKVR